MQLIIPPLKSGDTGSQAANLIEALLALVERGIIKPLDAPNRPTAAELKSLSAKARDELNRSLFNGATQQLVVYFQVQQGLGDNLKGQVEEKTAAQLNEFLQTLGLIDPPDSSGFVVRGTVRSSDGQSLPGATVRAFDRDLRKEQLLGEVTTDDQGQYSIGYRVDQFALGDVPSVSAPKLIVRAFTGGLQIGADVRRPKPTHDEVVDFQVTAPPLSEWETTTAGIIPLLEGQGEADNQALPPWELNDNDFDFISDETGLDREKVRLWTLAFVVGRDAPLDGSTGDELSARSISLRSGPDRVAGDGLLTFAIFYGWFRLGLPGELSALWALRMDVLITTLKTAIDRRVVPAISATALDGIGKRIDQIKLDLILQRPAPGMTAPLGNILATLPVQLEADQQRAIAAALPDLRTDDPKLTTLIADIPGLKDNAPAVARTLRLGDLTQGNLPLVKVLQDRLQLANETEGTLRPLAAVRPDEWLDLAYTYGTPGGSTLTPVAYADAMAAEVEQQHPTAALAAHFADGRRLAQQPLLSGVGAFLNDNPDFDLAKANLNLLAEKAPTGNETQHAPLLDGLRTLQRLTLLDVRWEEAATLLDNDLHSPQKLLDAGPGQLTALLDGQLPPERVAELHARAEDFFVTTVAAFTSAMSPLSGPKIMPAYNFGGGGGDVDPLNPGDSGDVGPVTSPPSGGTIPNTDGPAGTIELQTLADTLATHAGAFDSTKFRYPPAGGSGPIRDDPSVLDLGDTVSAQPTLQALFGSQDGCACEHCSSVLSPAAYFVDVLQFIRNVGMLGEIPGNAGLLALRPDLQDVELSCDNTDIEVPAIDLVLEILENAVALPLDIPFPVDTDIDAQLISGRPVGVAVREVLQRTVRDPLGEMQATAAGSHAVGTTDWTIIDGYRRWSLTVQQKVLRAQTAAGAARLLDTTGLDQAALMQALDQKQILPAAAASFAALFAPNRINPPDLGNYVLDILPLMTGMLWRITYRFVVQLIVDPAGHRLVLQTPGGTVWSRQNAVYSPQTIAEMQLELARGIIPELLRGLIAIKFRDTRELILTGAGNNWEVSSKPQTVILSYVPPALTIASLTYQSGDPGADAIAWPENHNPEAYVLLKGDSARTPPIPIPSFPWSLPFDLPLEEVRLFLERARSSRRRLMMLRLPIAQWPGDDAAFALEVLGLSEAEGKLIALPPVSDDAVSTCWGLTPTTKSIWDAAAGKDYVATSPLELLKNVSILLQQSRLSFEELQAVLATRFITAGMGGPLSITPIDTCVPSEMTLNGLTFDRLDRIHRFVRLQRRLGWAAADLDTALQLRSGGALDGAALQGLGSIVRLQELLGVSAAVILAWWPVPPATSVPSRLGGLAGLLGVSQGELGHALALFGMGEADVFASFGAVLGVCERLTAIVGSGIAFEDERYLLQHYQAPGSSVVLDADQIMQFALAASAAVHSIPDVPDRQPPPAASDPVVLAVQHSREDAVIAAVATVLGANQDLVDELLRVRLRHPLHPTDPLKSAIDVFLEAAFFTAPLPLVPGDSVKAVLVRLYKAVFICGALKFPVADLQLLRTWALPADPYGLSALDFNTLPVVAGDAPASLAGFEQLVALARLRSLAPGARDLLHGYVALNFSDPATTVAATIRQAQGSIAGGLVVDAQEVAAAAAQLGVTTTSAEPYRDLIVLTRLIEFLFALKQLGATVSQAADLTLPSPDESVAVAARELLHAKNGDAFWHDLIKPIADTLRERQRDALVDYLIADSLSQPSPASGQKGPLRLRDANDLYEHYLIDVQTSSCLKTTRLLQATASAQLFVQRLLLNLEGNVSLSPDKRQLWDWMGRYRVWEANRKVFLFPENWLLPELRDDKTATFGQLESALTEQESSPDVTRAALLGYVEELADLAQVSTIAMYQDWRIVGKDENGDDVVEHTLYVVGRTPDQPYRYFWRSCTNFGGAGMQWSGWEALDLDNPNDFIMPFVFEGDLHVAWPVFRKTKEEKKGTEDNAALLWEVQLAWTRRANKGWIKRKLGQAQFDSIPRLPNEDGATSFVFRMNKVDSPLYFPGNSRPVTQETITIDCYAANEVNLTSSLSPDPLALNDAAPSFSDLINSGDERWNVALTISGTIYEYAIVEDESQVRFNQGLPFVSVVLSYEQRWHTGGDPEGDVHGLTAPTMTDPTGRFSISIPAVSSSSKNGREGVRNGSQISLTILLASAPGGKVTLVHTLGDTTGGFFRNWAWTFTHGIENLKLKDLFQSGRQVKYLQMGRFIIESGQDLRQESTSSLVELPGPTPYYLDTGISINLPVDGNRYAETETPLVNISFGSDEGFLLPPPLLTPPVSLARAAQSAPVSGAPLEPAFYLNYKDGIFYLQKDATGTWQHWTDGVPFASNYRVTAALAMTDLFQPGFQSQLHFDALNAAFVDTFARDLPYANYNWELFLHAPLAIASHLSGQQRFEDARRWLHAIFDPTTQPNASGVFEFWRFLPFDNGKQPDAIAKMLTWFANPAAVDAAFATEQEAKDNIGMGLTAQISAWKRNPFMPHVVARLRPSSYQWYTFFAYLDMLIGWGDQQFRSDTRESVNEATQLYVLAAKLLGPRPRTITRPIPPPPETYRSLTQDGSLDDFSNAWVTYYDLPGMKKLSLGQNSVTTVRRYVSSQQAAASKTNVATGAVGKNANLGHQTVASLNSLAFCIPQNEKLGEYYDLIDDRLFKVRHCQNIDGVTRELPLFDPPIDPLLLIRARAAGLDLSSVIADLYAPLPRYRFVFTLQKALELTAELKGLGAALLGALEKQDAEGLALLRSSHEIAMLKLVTDTRKQQQAEADANIAALQQSEEGVRERFAQYQKLLGKTGITNGQDGLPVVEQSSSLSVSTDPIGGASGLGLSRREVDQLVLTAAAHELTQAANTGHALAGILALFPNIWAGGIFAGQTFGGLNLGAGATAIAKSIELGAADISYLANQMGTFGGYERRQDEWVHQSKLALAELKQIQKQIVAAEIRKAMADLELRNHEKQIEDAQEVDDFMHDKFTNLELCRWTSSQISEVYFRAYQLALDQARRAERAFQYELGLDGSTAPFVQSGNWDNLKKGLMAGDHLYHDLKRMEVAHLSQNQREFEITKHISLLQLDPLALIALRESDDNSCTFQIPEAIFDLDFPGHYLRRIKTVSVTIPCVTGPYAGVACTLTLTTSETRLKSADLSLTTDPYGLVSGTIVTSSGQNDSGLFEQNLRDERYLPFEGTGAVSKWTLSLPSAFPAFDYDTISDVIIHLRYTARDGGSTLATKATTGLQAAVNAINGTANGAGPARLFSLRHEYPTEWNKLTSGTPGGLVDFAMAKNRFPFLFAQKKITIYAVEVYALPSPEVDLGSWQFPAGLQISLPNETQPVTLDSDLSVGPRLVGKTITKNAAAGKLALAVGAIDADAKWRFKISAPAAGEPEFGATVEDLILICRYQIMDT